MMMTDTLSPWITQLSIAFPFLFPFETRHILFCTMTFGSNRALELLGHYAPELKKNNKSRFDRRRFYTVSREFDWMHLKEIFQNMASCPSWLHVRSVTSLTVAV